MAANSRGWVRHRNRLIVVTISVILLGGLLAALLISRRVTAPDDSQLSTESQKPSKLVGRYLFNGTVSWVRNYEDWSKRADGSTDVGYPFIGLSTFNRQDYDAWTADLECVSTDQVISRIQTNNQQIFNCRPEFLPEARKFFSVFNLANDYTKKLSNSGLETTRQNLDAEGIQYFGDPQVSNSKNCEVIALPINIVMQDKKTASDLPVAMCGFNYSQTIPTDSELKELQVYAEVMPVFAFVQAGNEYKPKANEKQIAIAHQLVDGGAKFVVMNGAGWVQNGEVYKGAPIFYSLGNFIFDQQYDNEVTRSVSLDLGLEINYTDDIAKWLELGKQCKIANDSCLANAKSLSLGPPNLKLSYDIVAGDGSNKFQKLASPEILSSIKERLGWQLMLANLGVTNND